MTCTKSDLQMSRTEDEITQVEAHTRPGKASSGQLADKRAMKSEIHDRESFDVHLHDLSPGFAAAIAARTALRAAPLMFRDAWKARTRKEVCAFAGLANATFRANALARFAVKYPTRAATLNAAALVRAARAAASMAANDAASSAVGWAVLTAASALAAAADAVDAGASALTSAADIGSAFADDADAAPSVMPLQAPASSFVSVFATADGDLRTEIRLDASTPYRLSARALADLRLWSRGPADWMPGAWDGLRLALPRGEDWDVWIDWYEDRLRGGSSGEAYDLVFVSAPPDVWDKGPAASNAWIKNHLPKASGPRAIPKRLLKPA